MPLRIGTIRVLEKALQLSNIETEEQFINKFLEMFCAKGLIDPFWLLDKIAKTQEYATPAAVEQIKSKIILQLIKKSLEDCTNLLRLLEVEKISEEQALQVIALIGNNIQVSLPSSEA